MFLFAVMCFVIICLLLLIFHNNRKILFLSLGAVLVTMISVGYLFRDVSETVDMDSKVSEEKVNFDMNDNINMALEMLNTLDNNEDNIVFSPKSYYNILNELKDNSNDKDKLSTILENRYFGKEKFIEDNIYLRKYLDCHEKKFSTFRDYKDLGIDFIGKETDKMVSVSKIDKEDIGVCANKKDTYKENFENKNTSLSKVNYIHSALKETEYYEMNGIKGISISNEDSKYKLYIFISDNGIADLRGVLNNSNKNSIYFSIPKFKEDEENDITSLLTLQGANNIGYNNISKSNSALKLDRMYQKVRFSIKEENNTERDVIQDKDLKEFRVGKPFVFMLCNLEDEDVALIGKINKL